MCSAGDFVKNWRSRFFTLHIKPIPILAYYRDEQKQRSPTQMLFLKGAKVEVWLILPAGNGR